ncbi:hypothetical protein ABTY00_24175 [Streptomyces microflavus]|uniref:hypothetical protein n=1 Tax=Streptomyces microflavus TaxID=1919 RepID=UPI003318B311
MNATPAPLPPWHDLLAAVTEMLDVPLPQDYSDMPAHHQLLKSRVSLLRGYLGNMVDKLNEPDVHADGIRTMKSSAPVTYPPFTLAEDRPTEAGR